MLPVQTLLAVYVVFAVRFVTSTHACHGRRGTPIIPTEFRALARVALHAPHSKTDVNILLVQRSEVLDGSTHPETETHQSLRPQRKKVATRRRGSETLKKKAF